MSYFGTATMVISEIGGHGNFDLPEDEFHHGDRCNRIRSAAESLCDFVYEYLLDDGHIGECHNDDNIRFKQEHLSIIARMIAVGMMAQFDHDEEMSARVVAGVLNENGSKAAP